MDRNIVTHAGQAQKEFFVNEAHALTDMLVHTAIVSEETVPPTDPAQGEIWIVAPNAVGDWAGKDGKLVGQQAGSWKFIDPIDGMQVYDQSTKQFVVHADGWTRPSAPAAPNAGSTVDAELRLAFSELIEALRIAAIFPEN